MTPFSPGQDIFKSQADTRFNSFADPMNSVNMNPGNWGINSSYMTPSYMSPYRPQYQGPQGNQYNGSNPTFAQSANYIANPFRSGGDNYGGNYWQQSTPFHNSIVNRPMDQAASLIQNWGVPLAASYGAMRGFSGMGSRIGGSFGGGLAQGLAGRSIGTGSASMAMSTGKMVGGMAGGFMFPAAIAQGAISGFDAAIMDPFVAQRQMSNNLRQNFAGQTFGQVGVGDPYQGGGINRRTAAGMSMDMSKFAAKDLTFTQKEVATLSDYSARSGLLDNVNANQLTSKMKEITKQVKLVMSVANTSDFKEAIEILGKLQMAGATGGTASRVMTQLGSFAAMGGISTQKLMNTVGMQGQYTFGSNGLTPYVGQLAAGQAYGSMASAFRSGLLSPALAARMGGVEGATQSAVSGMVGFSQSPYAGMYAHNGYMGKGETGNIVGNVSRFGGDMAKGGLSAVGDFNMNRPALVSRMLEEQGIKSTEQMLYQMGRSRGNGDMTKEGKLKSGSAYMMLTNSGNSHDEAMAILQQLRSYQDPKSMAQMNAGNDRSQIDSRMKFMQQQGADYGRFTDWVQPVLGIGRSAQSGGAGLAGKVTSTAGGMGDDLQNWWNEAKFGKVANMKSTGFTEDSTTTLLKNSTSGKSGRLASFSFSNAKHINTLNALARQGDPDAIKAISGSGREQRDAIYNLARDKKIDSQFINGKETEDLLKVMGEQGTETISTKGENLKSNLDEMFGNSRLSAGKSVIDNLAIFDAVKVLSTTSEDSAEWNKARKDLDAVYGRGKDNGLTKQEIAGIINSDDIRGMQKAGVNGLSGLLNKIGVKSESELNEKASKAGGYDKLAAANLKGSDLEYYHNNKEKSGAATAYALAMQKAAGGSLRGSKYGSEIDHLSNGQLNEGLTQESVYDSQREKLKALGQGHKIDFSAMEQGLAAIDNKESTGIFSRAVTEFREAVGEMTGKKPGTLPALNSNPVARNDVRKNQ